MDTIQEIDDLLKLNPLWNEDYKSFHSEAVQVLIDAKSEIQFLMERISELESQSITLPVSDKEIEQVADDEKQQDWDRLEYRDIYRDGFIDGAHWMQERTKRITPLEGV
jgi:hypothetical protein